MKAILYAELARYYDRIYSLKNYQSESKHLRRLVKRKQRSHGRELLEAGCGTGAYLEHFEQKFSCTGIDLSPAMLRVAKKRLKKTTLLQGDMRSFELGKEFDVVLCLFSSIANLKTVRDLQQTLKTFSKHMKVGGVLILGPWKFPEHARPGEARLFVYDAPDVKLARIDFPKKKGAKGIFHFHWMIAEKNKQVRFISEDRHELTEFTNAQYMQAMRAAGLTAEFIKAKKPGTLGLYVAVKKENKPTAK